MSRKDYKAIADAIRIVSSKYASSYETELAVRNMVEAIGNVMAADNARFDRKRFEEAAIGDLFDNSTELKEAA